MIFDRWKSFDFLNKKSRLLPDRIGMFHYRCVRNYALIINSTAAPSYEAGNKLYCCADKMEESFGKKVWRFGGVGKGRYLGEAKRLFLSLCAGNDSKPL